MTLGRNRSFDKDSALEKAMGVFWQNGYPGTSLTDLTKVMGINKSSLYAAFGNKEALFDQVIAFYLNKHGVVHSAELFKAEFSLKERIRNYLFSIADMLVDPDLPKGCLICLATAEVAGDCVPQDSANKITDINQNTISVLTDFIEKEQTQKNMPAGLSANGVAHYLLTLQFGLAVAARNGSDREQLRVTIDIAIRVFQFD